MRRRSLLFGCLSLAAFFAAVPAAEANPRKVERLSLKDTTGKSWTVEDLKGKKAVVVVFVGTQCPINNAFMPRLGELYRTCAEQGALLLAINPNVQDTEKDIADHAREHKIPFPVLRDPNQAAADQFGAKRTPEAFVLDGQLTVRYQGRIDDQFGLGFQRAKASRNDLGEAIEEVLAGKAVSVASTPVAGCLIGRAARPKAAAAITFTKHVSRILQSRCQECHRPNHVGPMPLMTYDDAASWSGMIREVVSEKRMPPWGADPKHGKFANDRSLSKADHDTLIAWIDQGCPEGDAKELPPPRQFAEGWTIGKPDAVFSLNREVTVPAKAPKNGVRYQYHTVKTDFDEDKWVLAAEARPSARAVVHHIIVYVVKPGERRLGGPDGIGNGFLVGYAPGDIGVQFPPGSAKKLPKGATLVFQMHYTPNGIEQKDRSSVGLIFAKGPPKHEVKTRAIAQQLFLIPPNADNHRVLSQSTFRQDTILWGLLPHMHLRGKSFAYEAVLPDGTRKTVLSVPHFDFGWQASYRLAEPMRLPAGTRIECTAHFDNSKGNPWNPDPSAWVRWGDQTWEEMMIGFLDYTYLPAAPKD